VIAAPVLLATDGDTPGHGASCLSVNPGMYTRCGARASPTREHVRLPGRRIAPGHASHHPDPGHTSAYAGERSRLGRRYRVRRTFPVGRAGGSCESRRAQPCAAADHSSCSR
jgi:hypothetical protein